MMRRRQSHPQARGWIHPAGFIAGLVLVVGVFASLSIYQMTHEIRPATVPGGDSGEWPFIDAVSQPDLLSAENAVGRHIYRPASCSANDKTVTSVYVNADNKQIYVDWTIPDACPDPAGDLIQLWEAPRDSLADPQSPAPTEAELLAWARSQVATMGNVASLVYVGDVPAVALQGNFGGDCSSPALDEDGCAPKQHNRTAIVMRIGNDVLELYAPGEWSVDELLAVAQTIS